MKKTQSLVLLLSVFLVAICGLIYELLAGTVSSYLVGSSIMHFSLVIGLFLTAMGIGSFLSKFLHQRLLERFILIEIMIAVLGGCSSMLLFAVFSYGETYLTFLVVISGSIGTLIGLEIPIIIRILKEREDSLRLTVANVMTVDYIGALVASLAFPFLLVPYLGLMRASFVVGLLNLGVAWLGIFYFSEAFACPRRLKLFSSLATVVLVSGIIFSTHLVAFFEERIYPDEVIYTKQTPYQRIVVTRWHDDTRLFLNGNLQFSSKDEYRYHESLVHPAMGLALRKARVLILGGGDGMAARECFKYKEVKEIDLVDIDAKMTQLFRDSSLLSQLNAGALKDKRLKVINVDAMEYLKKTIKRYDLIFVDFPDPGLLELGKLYTKSFYTLLTRRLSDNGIIAIQCSSPYYAADAYWCIINTLRSVPLAYKSPEAKLQVLPYHAQVPSFGIWGFALASARKLKVEDIKISVPTRFLDKDILPGLFVFPVDLRERKTEINRLDNQILIQYYNQGYKEFYD